MKRTGLWLLFTLCAVGGLAINSSGALGAPVVDPNDVTPPDYTVNVAGYQTSIKQLVTTVGCNEDCRVALKGKLILPRGYFDDLPKGSDVRRIREFSNTTFVVPANQKEELGYPWGDMSNTPLILKRIFKAKDTAKVKLTLQANDVSGNYSEPVKRKVTLGPKRK